MKQATKQSYARLIKDEAARVGFQHCGIAKAEQLDDEARQLEDWLNQGMNGKMSYMANYFDKRTDPRKLVDGAESVISLAYNYYTDREQNDPEAPQISKYAYGEDYHHVLKNKLKTLFQSIRDNIGQVEGRVFVDSAPVLDRAWAQKSGVGWVGKNANILNRQNGSYFFLAEIILDLPLAYDPPINDYCGSCTKCIDACPTDAIYEPYKVDGSKCISYLTIELKDAIPDEFEGQMGSWMFGCDICQQVCPWNRFAKEHNEPAFAPHDQLLDMTKDDWQELTEETFRRVFKKSAVKRTKYRGLKRNINYLYKGADHQWEGIPEDQLPQGSSNPRTGKSPS